MNEQKKSKSSVGKIFIVIIILIALGVGYWLVSPLFFDKEVNESMADIRVDVGKIETSRSGIFEGVAGHNGGGQVTLLQADTSDYVRFEDNFSVTNGPDLFVYLGRDGEYDPATKLGKLKGSKGGQNYLIPENISVGDYNEVWVYCRAFKVPFSVAKIR